MLRYKTELVSFSHLVRRLARKWSGSILTNPEPTRGTSFTESVAITMQNLLLMCFIQFIL